ncbi:MAG TPA: Dabb family protein [Ideonella sp.]|nr:Dabb family protein [Ideonella sp.]
MHIVAWRLNGGDEAERLAQAQAVVEAVEATRGRIPGLLSLDTGINIVEGADAWDVGAVMVFASRADLDAYQTHPAHLALKAVVGPLRSARSQVDFERTSPYHPDSPAKAER